MNPESLLMVRKLSIEDIASMTDDEAAEAFKRIRWPEGIYCPRCDCGDLWTMKSRPEWKCKNCNHRFTITSGTIFAAHKMPPRNYLMAIALFLRGKSSRQMGKEMGIQYRAAYYLQQRLRSILLEL